MVEVGLVRQLNLGRNGSTSPLRLGARATSFFIELDLKFEESCSGWCTCLGGSHFEFSARKSASLNSGVVVVEEVIGRGGGITWGEICRIFEVHGQFPNFRASSQVQSYSASASQKGKCWGLPLNIT